MRKLRAGEIDGKVVLPGDVGERAEHDASAVIGVGGASFTNGDVHRDVRCVFKLEDPGHARGYVGKTSALTFCFEIAPVLAVVALTEELDEALHVRVDAVLCIELAEHRREGFLSCIEQPA